MARRPAVTLIFLGAQRTDRIDFGAAPEFAALTQHHQAAHGGDDPVTRLEAALLAPKPGKTVWVLWEGASAQLLDMPSAVVDGLEREQLADALSFEAEPLTGISSADSAIDGIAQSSAAGVLPDFRRYWITQLSASLRDRMKTIVLKSGAKFGGVAHPGALPRARWDTANSTVEWRRVEIWDQLTFSLHGKSNGTIEKRVIRSSPGSEGWTAELPTQGPVAWLAARPQEHEPALFTPDGLPIEISKIEFPEEAVPLDWLRGWAAELSAKLRRVPLVEALARISPLRKFYIAGGLAAALVIAACVAHGGWLSMESAAAKARADQLENMRAQMAPKDNSAAEEAKLSSESDKLQPRVQELTQRESALTAELDKLDKLAAERAGRETRLGKLQALHRPALGELLAALADSERNGNTGSIVVKEVRQDGSGELKLSGLCRPSSLADAFATKLEARLGSSGWKIGAAQKILRDDRVAFDFSLVLTPAVLVDQPAPVAPTKPVTLSEPVRTKPATGGRSQ